MQHRGVQRCPASALGEALYRLGRPIWAEKYLVESYRTVSTDTSADEDAGDKARERIARFYTERGQRAKLHELLTQNPRRNGSRSAT